MSSFQQRMDKLKQSLMEKGNDKGNYQSCTSVCVQVAQTDRKCQEQLCIQKPIVIQKKDNTNYGLSSSRRSVKEEKPNVVQKNKTMTVIRKREVEPFVPIQIPPMNKRNSLNNLIVPTPDTSRSNREIEIKIERDDSKDKECLKKLFKKIHKLTE